MGGGSHSAGRVAGLFAGVGGFELGFHKAGFEASLLVENAPAASAVLRRRFPGVPIESDVRELAKLPPVKVLTAGFPCQDLSSVGAKSGIFGAKSGLVSHVFRLLEEQPTEWVVLENVPFILQLSRGDAMSLIARNLERLGYAWAYRTIDSQAFGVPHRRRRWFLVASQSHDPRGVLLSTDVPEARHPRSHPLSGGFYWTEGTRALGWQPGVIPPIKPGSTVGVASPPAILLPNGEVVTPDIRDAERLQGFPVDWTKPAEKVAKPGFRWQLVGNAVTVPVSAWIAERILEAPAYNAGSDERLARTARWPAAAWGTLDGRRFASTVGPWPVWRSRRIISSFLRYPARPLSARAAAGFLARTEKGSLRFPEGFVTAVEEHQRAQLAEVAS